MKKLWVQKTLPVFVLLMAIIGLLSIRQAYGDAADANTHLADPDNPHNLSNWATHGFVQAALSGGTDQICIFCHTPHGAYAAGSAPLWNRSDPWGGPFPLYGGALAIKGNFGNYGNVTNALYGVGEYPNGASRLCMSCHDGVTAIGVGLQRDNSDIVMVGSGGHELDADGSLLDTLTTVIDLSTSHPISFVYSDSVAGQIEAAYDAQLGAGTYFKGSPYDSNVRAPLDGQERMQCTTCHDPHYANHLTNSVPPFWGNLYRGAYASEYDAVCDQCHLGTAGSSSGDHNPGPGMTYP